MNHLKKFSRKHKSGEDRVANYGSLYGGLYLLPADEIVNFIHVFFNAMWGRNWI